MSDIVQDLEKEVAINVRSPSLNETLAVTIKLKSTVLLLKESIKLIHPHQPAAENQRIIYSGKLLQDSELLSDVIKTVDDEVTPIFHLVVKPSLQSIKSQQAQQQFTNAMPQAAASNISMPTTSTSSAPLPEPNTNNVNNSNSYPFVQTTVPNNNNPNVPAYPSVLPGGYQVVMINGNYYLAPVLVPSQPLPSYFDPLRQLQPNTQHPSFYHQQYPQSPQYQPHQAQQPQAQEPIIQPYINFIPPQNNNNNVNAAGAGAPVLVRPANAQRAASVWLALKLVVVLFMVCQGASIERIFIFHTIAFLFFLYQTGRLRFVLRRVRVEDINNRFRGNNNIAAAQRPPPPIPTQTPQQQQQAEGSSTAANNNNADGLNQRRGQGNDRNAGSSSSATPERPRAPPTFLDVCKRGAYTFFASLWPTYGQDPRIAQAFENNNDQREGLEEF